MLRLPATKRALPSRSTSSTDVADRRVEIGAIGKPHGIAGRVLVRPATDAPDLRFAPGARLVTDEIPPRALEVVGAQPHGAGLIVRFSGIDDRNAAEALRGVRLTIAPDERRTLAAGEYWPDELTGCDALDLSGRRLGTVAGVVAGAAQDRIVVATPHGVDVEVPFVGAIVVEVDIAVRRVVIDAPAGLFPED